ncbi:MULTISPECIES: dTDP-4-dehydrorhamnose reductase [Empedobacter]|uniref:dTDP-4-dehydrorhamnose reductase n=1 Tax=Empedobacter falsenii TaxID=343874 RepID=A0A427BS17_9FLAO|nr:MULTISPECIES: dTDP-4-dehydrorhamnose reductase [Empedobacter]MDH0658673.1 dTDP-4-dehydrorhamnose reductase [Empedobacter sp. GD03865]MDH1601282.1 dTDP-4-dehydrorhamnose reductase [Empedobacter sp. GD03739]RRT93531.1 dTDP-4-dehydrorhamnose reductase [Empedobacter falsenii]RRT93677.1 dTDP-4-dehydrorhamnose reductase [Empedobacter falsenii]
MKRILVTGANGQLGQSILEQSKNYKEIECFFVTRNELDITNEELINHYFEDKSFDFVVNCAAYTAVDKAEDDQENAYLVNAKATEFLAKITNQKGIPFIHVSTDYVFDGTEAQPRLETDQTNPIGVYGQTKLDGENLALENNSKTIILRTAWVYSRFGNNFVKTMLRLFNDKDSISVVADQIGSPTNAIDLADVILTIILKDDLTYGIFNYSNEGKCSWFEFAQKIKELSNSTIEINPVPTSAYPTKAKRPAYSLLDKSKIKEVYQFDIPTWEDSLKKELKHLI